MIKPEDQNVAEHLNDVLLSVYTSLGVCNDILFISGAYCVDSIAMLFLIHVNYINNKP